MLKMIKKGDIVARISYHKDVIFVVDLVIDNKIAILTGITTRLKADSPIEDLELINKKEIDNGSDCRVKAECDMGRVEINFE